MTQAQPTEEEQLYVRNYRQYGTKFEKFFLGSLLIVGGLCLFNVAFGYFKLHQAKGSLRTYRANVTTAAHVTAEQARFGDISDEWVEQMATSSWSGDWYSSKFKKDRFEIMSTQGGYLRLPMTRTNHREEVRRAARESKVDGLVSCFVRRWNFEPEWGNSQEIKPIQVYNFHNLYRGLDPFSKAWAKQIDEADSMLRVQLLRTSMEERVAEDLPLAQKNFQKLSYAIVVIDEVPAGTKLGWFSNTSHVLQARSHAARLGIFDIESGKLLAKVRVTNKETKQPRMVASLGSVENGFRSPRAYDVQEREDVKRQVKNCDIGSQIAGQIIEAAQWW
jgi:hypothetical protein